MFTDCQDGCTKFPWMFRELDSLHLVLHPVIQLGETLAIMNHKIPRTANSVNIRIIFVCAFRIWPCIVPPQGAPAQWRDLGGFSQQLPTGCAHLLGNCASCHQMFSWFSWIFWPLICLNIKSIKRRGCQPESVPSTNPLLRFADVFSSSQANPNTTTFQNYCHLNLIWAYNVQWT